MRDRREVVDGKWNLVHRTPLENREACLAEVPALAAQQSIMGEDKAKVLKAGAACRVPQPSILRLRVLTLPHRSTRAYRAVSYDCSQQERPLMTRPTTQAISPFFIVSNVDQTVAFYRDKLGFETRFQEPDRNPFFAIIGRDGAQLFVKADKDVLPLRTPSVIPSCAGMPLSMHQTPMRLAAEFAGHGAAFSEPLKDTHDGCAASRFAILTATSCSSGDLSSRGGPIAAPSFLRLRV